jgi:hypothetical protein
LVDATGRSAVKTDQPKGTSHTAAITSRKIWVP